MKSPWGIGAGIGAGMYGIGTGGKGALCEATVTTLGVQLVVVVVVLRTTRRTFFTFRVGA
jgi:hypothetical protein